MNTDAIVAHIRDGERVVRSLRAQAPTVLRMGNELVRVLRRGGRIFTAGNGGSAAEAMHMAEELVGRFRSNRRPLPGIALVADATALTCIANDFGFEAIVSRQVTGLSRKGDALVLFSTSGNSPNLLAAMDAAARAGVRTVCLLGKGGGKMAPQADLELTVRSTSTARIQEAHQLVMHMLLEIIEDALGEPPART